MFFGLFLSAVLERTPPCRG